MGGPRDYRHGTRMALAALSRGTCYFPGCDQAMVRFLDGYLDPFVECQITHIKDARQGNRYDPSMSDEERRSFPNLILLCKAHHELVDKRCPEQYPAEVLTMWKRDVEQSLDAGALSSLEDRDLEEALAFGAVAIRDSLLDLGGRGGNAPGAGGGGGGAIGRGAVGGSGGAGGDLHLDGRPGIAPGAGGGGIGVVGPNARGGEGGGGGEMFERLIKFDEEDVASLRFEIGDGGRGGQGRGEDGGDTVVELIRADGTVTETIRAAGGKGGAPGTLGTLAEVVTAILCNAAELRDGLFYSLGVGWTTFTAETIPFEFRAPLMLAVQLDDDRAGHVSIELEDPDGARRELASPSFELPVDTLVPRVNALLSLSATIEQPGVWTLTISGSNTINLPLEISAR